MLFAGRSYHLFRPVSIDLECEAQFEAAVTACRSEAVLEVFMIEEILDSPGETQPEIVPSKRKRIPGCHIESAIPTEPVGVLVKIRIAKHRSQIRTGGEKIGANPESLDPLCNDECELVVWYPESFAVGAGKGRYCRPAKVTDVAVCKCIRREYIRRSRGPYVEA